MVRPNRHLILVLGLALAACTVEAPADTGTGEAAPVSSAQIEELQPIDCPDPDEDGACYADHRMGAEQYPQALAGDYQSQRNVAYLFARSDYILARPIQACAWRLVILATRPADGSPTDESEVSIDCGRLSERDRAEAQEVANLIHRRIHGSDLPTG